MRSFSHLALLYFVIYGVTLNLFAISRKTFLFISCFLPYVATESWIVFLLFPLFCTHPSPYIKPIHILNKQSTFINLFTLIVFSFCFSLLNSSIEAVPVTLSILSIHSPDFISPLNTRPTLITEYPVFFAISLYEYFDLDFDVLLFS